MNRVSGVFKLTVTKDGDTLGGCLLVDGILDQQKDTNSGTVTPDYTNPDNQPVIFPRVVSTILGGPIEGTANFTNVKWYFNSSEISNDDTYELGTRGEPGSEVPSLKIKKTPVDTAGSYSIRFEADVNNGSSLSKVIFVISYSLTESSNASYTVILYTKNGGIVSVGQNEVLTPYLRLGANVVSSGVFFKYYKMVNGSWQAFGDNGSSRQSITVTPSDVDGIDLFKVDVHIGNANGSIICSDAQEVIDDSDPYQIVAAVNEFKPGVQQTVTPKVYKGETDVTTSEGWNVNLINLVFSDGTIKKTSSNGSISISYDEVKDDAGVPYLYIEAVKG